MDYKQKYFKYKQKYLKLLKDQKGGEPFLMDILTGQVFSYLFERNQILLQLIYTRRLPVMKQSLGNFRLNPIYRLELLGRSGLSMVLATRLVESDRRNGFELQLAKRILSQTLKPTKLPLMCVATIPAHNSWVISVAFHPTLPLLASGSTDNNDRTIKLWDCTNLQKNLPTLKVTIRYTQRITSVAFHPILPLLASGSQDGTVKLWDCKNPQNPYQVANLTGHISGVNSVAFHPTLLLLATGSYDNTVKLWDCTDPQNPTFKATILIRVDSVAFHPTLHLLASGSYNNVKLWDFSDPQNSPTFIADLTGHTNDVSSVAFHQTLPLLASASDNTVKLWNCTDAHNPTLKATIYIGRIRSLAFHTILPLLASGSHDRTVKIWDCSDAQKSPNLIADFAGRISGHISEVNSVAFHPTLPLLASGSQNGIVKIYR
jgi:WD40 repeat protein